MNPVLYRTFESVGSCVLLVHSRSLYPLELDIAIPSLKLSIEYNGIYYHSSNNAQDRDLWKLKGCIKHGYRHIVIWEDEFNIVNNNYDLIDELVNKSLTCEDDAYMRNIKYFSTLFCTIQEVNDLDINKTFEYFKLSDCDKNFRHPSRPAFIP